MKKFAILLIAAALAACGPSDEIDSRSTINADGQHRREIAKAVNGSRLWQTYFEKASSGSRFVPTLTEMLENQWMSDDLRAAAEVALQKIQGKG